MYVTFKLFFGHFRSIAATGKWVGFRAACIMLISEFYCFRWATCLL